MESNSPPQQSSSVFGDESGSQPPVTMDAGLIPPMDFDSTTSPTVQPKKRFWIILTAITLSLDCALGFGVWLTSRTPAVPANPSVDESLNQNMDGSSPSQGDSGGKVQSVEDLAEQIRNLLGDGATVETADGPLYQVPGYQFYVSTDFGVRVSRGLGSDLAAAEIKRQEIIDYLQAQELEEIDNLADVAYYAGNGFVCDISDPAGEGILPDRRVVSSGCGYLDDYPGAAAEIQPFAELLDVSGHVVLDAPKISDGAAAGYQVAEVGLSDLDFNGWGAMMLFYRKTGGNWRFFSGTQTTIECSEYNNDDVRAAFRGTPCYDDDGTLVEVE